jgi:hypothetical protein
MKASLIAFCASGSEAAEARSAGVGRLWRAKPPAAVAKVTKIVAPKAIPKLCPVYRDIPNNPDAMPRFVAGTADITELLFGAVNMPSPKPNITSLQTICGIGIVAVIWEIRNSPIITTARPAVAIPRAPRESERRPETGADNIRAKGIGIIRSPAVCAE